MIQNGEMISAVAVTETGEVIGHCALSGRPGDPAGQEGTPTRDLLCLQYLNGSAVDYERLQIYTDFGRELMGYVRAQDPLG